ncbi:MAG: glycerol-3-phosphate dehydrogenase [SAR202 cluster bacterium Io17-Chloro-G9]|nr:MAG: glycerol-3-phosphate dehydrogenase [SAR202 cluster bacterium Io17-Chloro-G9]
MTEPVAIIGATTWGTTLGIILARTDHTVRILARSPTEAAELNSQRRNARFLPETPFPSSLTVSSDVAEVVSPARLIILAVPSHRLRQNLQNIRDGITSGSIVVSAAKGLELPAGKRMSQVLEEELSSDLHPGICVLSGPNLAKEIIQGKLASTVIAGREPAHTRAAQAIMMSNSFRVYTSDDVIGVELAGALKNIIALGAGIADGMDVGENGKSAFITRGLVEITRLGIAAGAHPLTFAGLAGLGDLLATCASQLSRNRYVGEQLARGRSWPEIRSSMDNVAEGVNTTGAALTMATELHVEMPIAQATYRVLFEGLSPQEAIAELMERPPRSEW